MCACVHVCMCACMDVCMYVCMYGCMYVCMYACMHAWLYVCMYVRTYVRMYVCMYGCMYVCMHACMAVCMYVCMHACMHVCMYVCTYAHPAIWLHLRLTWSFESSGQVANCHPLLQSQRSVLDPGRPETRSDEVDWKFESLLPSCSFFMGFKQKHSWDIYIYIHIIYIYIYMYLITYVYIYIYIHILRHTLTGYDGRYTAIKLGWEIPRRNSVGFLRNSQADGMACFKRMGKPTISRILWNI